MFGFGKKIELRFETGETIPCTSLESAERRALHRVIYQPDAVVDILKDGKAVKTVSSAPPK